MRNLSDTAVYINMHMTQSQEHRLSFSSAKKLRALNELLPGGPEWLSRELKLPGFKAKKPIILYYRDTMKCVEFLFGNPIFARDMEYSPKRVWKTAERLEQIYGEMMSGDWAWDIQVSSLGGVFGFSKLIIDTGKFTYRGYPRAHYHRFGQDSIVHGHRRPFVVSFSDLHSQYQEVRPYESMDFCLHVRRISPYCQVLC